MRILRKNYIGVLITLLVGGIIFTQCSDSLTNTEQDLSKGNLVIKMTDAPFPIDLIEEANVTISKIEIRKVIENDTADSNPFMVVSDKDTTLNLLDLTNDVTATLVDLELDPNTFDLVRLYVSDASITVVDSITNGPATFDMKVPSGPQTGIKVFIEPPITVEGGLTTELLLDFDVSKSFVVQGNPFTPAGIKGFIFKPVIRAVNQSTAGQISGFVSDTTDSTIADAQVWVTKADTVFSSTMSDTTGFYALIGLPEGMYDLYGVKSGFDTTMVSGVTVTAGNKTSVDLELVEQ